MTHKIFNAVNILATTAFLALIGAVGATEWDTENGGTYWRTAVLIVVFAVCRHLAAREDGKKR